MVFTLVISKIFLARMPSDIICILRDLITNPEVPHLHLTGALMFNGVVCNANSGGVVAMDRCLGCGCLNSLRVNQKIMPSLQFKKRAPSLASAAEETTKQRIAHKVKNAPFNLMGCHVLETIP